VLLTGLTVALIVFTPMKMYIPGYGDASSSKALKELKIRTDSLEQAMQYKDKYLASVKSVLLGDPAVKLDTMPLQIPVPEKISD
jgi:hypothetical protein